jgi:hypothetical protein
LSFATILPAISVTRDFLKSFRFFQPAVIRRRFPRGLLAFEMVFGGACITLPVLYPSVYTGPLVWAGYLFFFAPLNYWLGIPGVLKERERGEASEMISLLAAGYLCGIVWETLNFWAGAKWVYHVPYFEEFKFFEMPLLGFLGFGPFAVAFLEMYRFVRYLPKVRLAGHS